MKRFRIFKLSILVVLFALVLMACSDSTNNETEEVTGEVSEDVTEQVNEDTVEITDAHGTVSVPVNPENVVALDNRTFETLADWGIDLAAVPKPVMPADISYVGDDSVQDVGNHREPNLEVIAAVDPDLVIVGQRFSGYYEDIKALVPNAAVIDLNFDVSEEAATPGENLINGFKDYTIALGEIFDKTEEAAQLISDFDQAIEDVKSAYNGADTVMSIVVSGGGIGFSAPQSGRVWGPLYDIFEWSPALEVDGSSSDHEGDDISVEAIAQSNPDWLFVLDRDAGVSSTEDATPAQDVIDNSPALQNITAVTEDKIVYAPDDTYTNESIQTFIELFEEIANALAN
ncbi:iron complex transport system substrate-binding protein [Amphibacillus marinus]|uniref:Iron complex transport system substrate-binding protein n=1 Tax=Amphibacillus marinus TaxID=872970 RepID=A0A1H8GJ50_9BACI|nr:ABC transporter substrate-binding protein [Amphibacillus marinus]SEN43764.1 iron complex transport system substrate-binding protein [Amphibacillus marinus]